MKKNIFPALGIVVVTIILLVINNYTQSTAIKDYALIWIIAGMFAGVFLSRISNKPKK